MLTLSCTLSPATQHVAHAAAAGTVNSSWTNAWQQFGNAGGRWIGADHAQSLGLPNGQVAWFFNDTFTGTMNGDGSMGPFNVWMTNNSIVTSGTTPDAPFTSKVNAAENPRPYANPGSSGWLWGGDAIVSNNLVKKFHILVEPIAGCQGEFCYEVTGTRLATFTASQLSGTGDVYNPAPQIETMPPASTGPAATGITWGLALLNHGGYTYIYGATTSNDAMARRLHVARVPTGRFTDNWQFYNGRSWTLRQTEAQSLPIPVDYGFSVVRTGTAFNLVTMDPGTANIVRHSASTPYSFATSSKSQLYSMPEAVPNWLTYEVRVHPAISQSPNYVVSYSVNAFEYDKTNCEPRIYRSPGIYRPRFIDVKLPSSMAEATASEAAPTRSAAPSLPQIADRRPIARPPSIDVPSRHIAATANPTRPSAAETTWVNSRAQCDPVQKPNLSATPSTQHPAAVTLDWSPYPERFVFATWHKYPHEPDWTASPYPVYGRTGYEDFPMVGCDQPVGYRVRAHNWWSGQSEVAESWTTTRC